MSRREMRAYGKQEFGQFPLITMEPRPERLTDYYKVILNKLPKVLNCRFSKY
jgi:hypothetical protein